MYCQLCDDVKETVLHIRKVIGDQDVQEVSHYSVQRLVKKTLEYFTSERLLVIRMCKKSVTIRFKG